MARPQRYGLIERADLARFTIGISGGKLQLQTSDPPGASGSIDYRVALREPETWLVALSAAAARRGA